MAEEAKAETAGKTKTCFVACPIGKSGSDVRKRTDAMLDLVIRPVAEPLGYEVIPAHEDRRPGKITAQIVERLVDSELVIADLTGPNPNVMYEVGIRNAFRGPIVLLCQAGQHIPFDLGHNRVVFVDYPEWRAIESGRDDLKAHIESALEAPEGASASPVTEAKRHAELLTPSPGGTSDDDRIGELAEVVLGLRGDIMALMALRDSGIKVGYAPLSQAYRSKAERIAASAACGAANLETAAHVAGYLARDYIATHHIPEEMRGSFTSQVVLSASERWQATRGMGEQGQARRQTEDDARDDGE